MITPAPRHTNRLIEESSPYLLQHAHNPVDWHPWGESAFRAARQQDKPVLLSIGYSACHWCHVMEHESFEDESMAELMNRHFVNIKVDREERPAVDAIYMKFVQMTTGSGGWPLTVFLTPDQVPFFGGTYFPPDDRYGRPGLRRLLQMLADTYENRRSEVEKNQQETVQRLQMASAWGASPGKPCEEILHQAATGALRSYDPAQGGFGGAPKFPSTMVLGFLLRYWKRSGSKESLEALHLSLRRMARGGIYDQVGGGFHRYSVDERWLVPHFEKMLYDNALLARLYLEAHQATGEAYYRQVTEEVLGWVQREMTDPSGGFYSALDADSEGEEGKFYVWGPEEIESVLGAQDALIFNDYFGVSASGNFEGKNIPHHRYEVDQSFAKNAGMAVGEAKQLLDECRRKLYQARCKRVWPGLDDKVLAAWNGMMLSAFAEAAWALSRSDFLDAALANARFLEESMTVGGRLKRTWKKGSAKLNAYLEDYALVAEGWLALYQVTGDVHWLERAGELTEQQIDLFWDEGQGNFFFTSRDHESLLVRQKEYQDNATPSGNSVSCLNLLKLAILQGKPDYARLAERLLENVCEAAAEHALGFGNWLQALDFQVGPVLEFALVGEPDQRRPLEAVLRRDFLPRKVLALADRVTKDLASKIPLLEGKGEDGRAVAYLCRDFACREPAYTTEELEQLLADAGE